MIKVLLSLISILLFSILIILAIPYFKTDEVSEFNKKEDTKIVNANKNKMKKSKESTKNNNETGLNDSKIPEESVGENNKGDLESIINSETVTNNKVNSESTIEYNTVPKNNTQNEISDNTDVSETEMNEEEILQRRMEERNPHGDGSAWGIELDNQQLEYKDYLDGKRDSYDQNMSDDQKQYVHESLPYLQK